MYVYLSINYTLMMVKGCKPKRRSLTNKLKDSQIIMFLPYLIFITQKKNRTGSILKLNNYNNQLSFILALMDLFL